MRKGGSLLIPNVNFLIKPASGRCNMRCRYCFYEDEKKKRSTPDYGVMREETLEAVVRAAFGGASRSCSLMFQGGEPTLAGLPFFEKAVQFAGQYNTKRIPVHYGIQTNGYVLDGQWARFFAANRFLTGLSLDGTKALHDRYRIDAKGEGTYRRVMRSAQLLNASGAEFNILTVVTAQAAKNAGQIYGFFKRSGLTYQQYIPCLDPLESAHGAQEYSLTPELYARFLKNLFDVWYQDIRRGEQIYIRYFENLAAILQGQPPETCGMQGRCSNQLVVEADGSVYPCDFYVLDGYRLGNIHTDSLQDLLDAGRPFVEKSLQATDACGQCRWHPLCRGGCRRDRPVLPDGTLGLNIYCGAYQGFFSYAVPRLQGLLRR